MKTLEQLIEGCIKGDRQSQNDLYTFLMPKMFGICLRYSVNREEAEDTLQEGFIKVFEHLHQYKFTGPFEGWVRKIMVNCALQKYRSSKQMHAVVSLENIAVEHVGSEDVLSRLGTKELLAIVQSLPPGYRTVFNLYVFEGMKHREIAKLLNISEGTSKSNLSDARTLLRRDLNKKLQSSQQNVKEL